MELTKEYYKKVLDNLYDGIYFIDNGKEIIYWNKGAEEHTGYNRDEVLGRHWDEILRHVDENGVRLCNDSCPISQSIADGCLREFDVYFHHREGHLVPASIRIVPLKDLGNQIVVAVEIFNENSPKFGLRQKIKELKKIALIDSLTGLGNRAYVEMNLNGRLEEMKRYGLSFGLLFIDIDHFKKVNDKYGHDTGDRVLRMLSKTMGNILRSFDIIGRWGGEEFIGIIVNVNEEQLYLVANRLRILVEQSSISIDPDIIQVTVSIGATLAQKDDDMNTIIKRSDRLMYKSKVSGRNRVSHGMSPVGSD